MRATSRYTATIQAVLHFTLTVSLTAILFSSESAAARQDAYKSPDEIEVADWELVVKQDDPKSYQRFIEKYPQTRFLGSATDALDRFRRIDVAAAEKALNRFTDSTKLNELSFLQPRSSFLGATLGTRFLGPGITIGGALSARQHILLPLGEWIPIASLDHEMSTFSTLKLTSAAFGKFDGDQLEELMLVTFNRESLPTQSQTTNIYAAPTWPALDLCDSMQPHSEYHLRTSDMRSRWCSSIRTTEATIDALEPPELGKRISTALTFLQVKKQEFKYRSETHVSMPTRAFISYTHLYRDMKDRTILVPEIGQSDVSLDPKLAPETRWHYLQQAHFAYHAAIAFGHIYLALQLQPEKRLLGSTVTRLLGRAQ